MTRRCRVATYSLAMAMCVGLAGCSLPRPETPQGRMIEPALNAESAPPATATPLIEVRLVDTQARSHIGRRLLHQHPDGELTEDPVWRWSSAPDRYLDTALRLAFTSSGDVRLVDSANALMVSVTLLAWQIERDTSQRLLAAIEVQVIGSDRVIHTQVIRESEPVSGGLPGDLSVVAGRLLGRLASDVSKRVAAEAPKGGSREART